MDTTQILGLNKPSRGELNWDIPLNENFDKLDSEVGYKCTLNKGNTTQTKVTETVSTLKQSVEPDYQNILSVDLIHVVANNPAGSGCTLYFMLKVLLDDESEANLLDSFESVAEGESFDDCWVNLANPNGSIQNKVPSGKRIKEVRLYAYCSSAPAANYEPTVQLERVMGVQN